MLAAVENDGESIFFASDRQRENKVVAMAAISSTGVCVRGSVCVSGSSPVSFASF